ncbi:MAG: class I SAM-dependent methyltransferase [Promethearchaeota archaeon]
MDKKDIVREGYNKTAEILEEIFGVEKEEENDKVKLLSEFSSRMPINGRVLDVGCGNGAYSRILSEYFDVIGVDISEKQIILAKKNAPQAKFIRQDMTKITFPNDYFDGILSYYSIIHVPREEHFQLLKKFYNFLKSNGVILITFHVCDDPESYNRDFFGTGAQMFWSGFDKETNIKMMQNIGFKIIWSKLIQEQPKFGDNYHLFILAKKSQ